MQLSVKAVAELLHVSEKTIYRWINENKLPGYRLSGQYRFNRAELLEWATANKLSVSPKIFEEAEGVSPSLPDLADALQTGGIFYRLSGVDKSSALRSMVEQLRLPEEMDREYLLQVFLAREALESTAIGDGIAIPHTRHPVVLHMAKPLVTLCFLENPVDFGALDGKPVQALVTPVSPTVKAHLHLLSRISFALRDPDFKALIIQQGSRDTILEMLRALQAGWSQRAVSTV